ncbi:hypothetical protein ABET41_07420 [Metabacillus fastidiosus]|uniref:Transposase n=1 Tax=Metabacillus fastidiosus TaxID=1458 RepID=A0ABU6NWZ4_9BACI|nr:hypothetical protein [Metabacillus fastidiosus]MED4400907.1 hypothetical protein [Metabacillus fastidiosus]MED4453516.1 hypothetical protein [Metabacillus fastidiosus]MED4463833.1 hypothetical protein [Metabacillus fastidiosus]
MYTKQCLRCENKSFSSASAREWECPYCGKDLAEEKARRANHNINIQSIYRILLQKKGFEVYRQTAYLSSRSN